MEVTNAQVDVQPAEGPIDAVTLHIHAEDNYLGVQLDHDTAVRVANAILRQAHFGAGFSRGVEVGTR
jgi:predicted oxidoreductase